ncbi:hypothetical protein H0H81_010864 [Sphagnurus paluster]|uniref:Uncharacterized protein n=1 Tax=Sphagnurus paluster TaxID=117069 RepID=A0A9P7KIG4_9AGAR|nr:hypothetical protein H0H81_010864 [Sphagnurus paluster]
MCDMSIQIESPIAQWKLACSNFNINVRLTVVSLVATLERIAQLLAQDEDARVNVGSEASLWIDLRKLWIDLTQMQFNFRDDDNEVGEEVTQGTSNKEKDLRVVSGSLAKFTRNLVAGVPENQVKA